MLEDRKEDCSRFTYFIRISISRSSDKIS